MVVGGGRTRGGGNAARVGFATLCVVDADCACCWCGGCAGSGSRRARLGAGNDGRGNVCGGGDGSVVLAARRGGGSADDDGLGRLNLRSPDDDSEGGGGSECDARSGGNG